MEPSRQPTAHRQHWYSDYRTLPPDLAADLRSARQDRGLSLQAAARAIGIDAGYLSRLERGLRAPRLAVAVRWAKVIGLDQRVQERLLDEAVENRLPVSIGS